MQCQESYFTRDSVNDMFPKHTLNLTEVKTFDIADNMLLHSVCPFRRLLYIYILHNRNVVKKPRKVGLFLSYPPST